MLDPRTFINFINFAEGLKNVLRHSRTSANRHESVAEHSWMLCLMATLLFDSLDIELDRLRVLKMLIVHDLPEIITGDIPAFDKINVAAAAQAAEEQAMEEMIQPLPATLQNELRALFHEFEARETPEAKVAYAIDKAEALIQHNIADISTWDENDIAYQTDFHNPRFGVFKFLPYLDQLKQQIDQDSLQKLADAGLADSLTPDED